MKQYLICWVTALLKKFLLKGEISELESLSIKKDLTELLNNETIKNYFKNMLCLKFYIPLHLEET